MKDEIPPSVLPHSWKYLSGCARLPIYHLQEGFLAPLMEGKLLVAINYSFCLEKCSERFLGEQYLNV